MRFEAGFCELTNLAPRKLNCGDFAYCLGLFVHIVVTFCWGKACAKVNYVLVLYMAIWLLVFGFSNYGLLTDLYGGL
ncbi:hypothetical protein TUM4261_00090 [Shewanella sp. c952]|nr:hypothetical protein TUM4261_00090 [Shewanella sp. c952]